MICNKIALKKYLPNIHSKLCCNECNCVIDVTSAKDVCPMWWCQDNVCIMQTHLVDSPKGWFGCSSHAHPCTSPLLWIFRKRIHLFVVMTAKKWDICKNSFQNIYFTFQTCLITQGGHSCRNIAQYLLLKQFLTATLTLDNTRLIKTEEETDRLGLCVFGIIRALNASSSANPDVCL